MLPPPHEGCRGNNLLIPRVADDRSYPQSSAKNQSNCFLIQALKDGESQDHMGVFTSPYLPCPIYRTYHPAYLQRIGKWEWIDYICDLVMASQKV